MKYSKTASNELSNEDKKYLIKLLTDNLPLLRACLGLSQKEVSDIIGVSRQTYSAIENMRKVMTWNTFLSLILFWGCNEKTAVMMDKIGILSPKLNEFLSKNNREGLI